MNIRKHLAGVAIFLAIFGGTVFIFNSLKTFIDDVSGLTLTPTQPATEVELSYEVPYVSLDFNSRQSYTRLSLDAASRHLPGRLWVRTYFFAPNHDRSEVWASEAVELRVPFMGSDRIETMSVASCDWCNDTTAPKAGYYARVIVSTRSASDTYLPDSEINREITTASPVVVQVERKFGR